MFIANSYRHLLPHVFLTHGNSFFHVWRKLLMFVFESWQMLKNFIFSISDFKEEIEIGGMKGIYCYGFRLTVLIWVCKIPTDQ